MIDGPCTFDMMCCVALGLDMRIEIMNARARKHGPSEKQVSSGACSPPATMTCPPVRSFLATTNGLDSDVSKSESFFACCDSVQRFARPFVLLLKKRCDEKNKKMAR